MRTRFLAALALGSGLAAATAGAQAPQYTAPGGADRGDVRSKEEIEQAMEDARWRLGPVRLAPWAGLRNVTYVDNVFGASEGGESDVTGTLGAGLTAYLPTGPKVFWVAQALPEYVWWLDLEERRELVGRYGAGVYADLNRLRLAANATRVEEQAVVTSETEQLAFARRDELSSAADLRLTGAFELFVSGRLTEVGDERAVGDDPRGAPVELLHREERGVRGGLRYRSGRALAVELGAEVAEVRFDAGGRDLSNRGTSPFVRIDLDGNDLEVDLEVVQRSMEPIDDSQLEPVDLTHGSLRLLLTPGWRFSVGPYGHRSTVYSLSAAYTHFTEERWGFQVAAPFKRLGAHAYVEGGRNDYAAPVGAADRTDDVTGWGIGLDVEVVEWLSYRIGFHRVEYDSNLPGFDREIDRVESTFNLGAASWIWR